MAWFRVEIENEGGTFATHERAHGTASAVTRALLEAHQTQGLDRDAAVTIRVTRLPGRDPVEGN